MKSCGGRHRKPAGPAPVRAARLIALAGFVLAFVGLVDFSSFAQTSNNVKVASAGTRATSASFWPTRKAISAPRVEVELTTLGSPQMIGRSAWASSCGRRHGRGQPVQRGRPNIAIRAVADKGSMRAGYGFSGSGAPGSVDSGLQSFKSEGHEGRVGTFGSANSSAVNEALARRAARAMPTWSSSLPQHLAAYANKAIVPHDHLIDRLPGGEGRFAVRSRAMMKSIPTSKPPSPSTRKFSRAGARSR
jgi:hypothetical protein